MTSSELRPLLAGTVITLTGHGVLNGQSMTIVDGRISNRAPLEWHRTTGPIVDCRDQTGLSGLATCHTHAPMEDVVNHRIA